MKRLSPPSITTCELYHACVSGIAENSLKDRFKDCWDDINEQADDYIYRAGIGTLFLIAPLKSKKDEDPIVIGKVRKSELINLYEYYMLKRQPVREIYDVILVAANDKCPFCGGIGCPKTLDHYLPKANYPQFSVVPSNLIPACRDCNTGKSNTLASIASEQVLHPYFDDGCFFSEQWVFAQVIQTSPCSLRFYVDAPANWDEVKKNRVKKHFDSFDLAKRYSIQAAEELSILVDQRRREPISNLSPKTFKEYLLNCADSAALFTNHWKRVMYQALSKNDWFCKNSFSHLTH